MEINQEEVDAFNAELAALIEKSKFSLGSEAFIQDGQIKSKVVLVPKPAPTNKKSKEELKKLNATPKSTE